MHRQRRANGGYTDIPDVRVKQPDDLLVFRGCRATRDVLVRVQRWGRGVGIEVLSKGERGDWSVVACKEIFELNTKSVQSLVSPLVE